MTDPLSTATTILGIVQQLNRARSCVITVVNRSNAKLYRMREGHAHGEFRELAATEIPPGGTDTFASVSSANSVGTGCEGFVTYAAGGMGQCEWTIRWSNPFVGKNSASQEFAGDEAHAYLGDAEHGGGDQGAPMRFTLRGGVTAADRPTRVEGGRQRR